MVLRAVTKKERRRKKTFRKYYEGGRLGP